MKKNTLIISQILTMGFFINVSNAQSDFNWVRVDTFSKHIVAGQLSPEKNTNRFERLPLNMKSIIRDVVWNLSQNTAGEYIDFYSDAETIKIKYQVTGSLNIQHMPSTGVSGLDVYLKGKDGEWFWISGQQNFADTITYTLSNIMRENGNRYRLYLPLYSSIKWMQIGVPQKSNIEMVTQDEALPIIAYGTSITQGANASRPGLVWTAILNRVIDKEIINLGFSGHGLLETPILNAMGNSNAALYILDCLPNLLTLAPEEKKIE